MRKIRVRIFHQKPKPDEHKFVICGNAYESDDEDYQTMRESILSWLRDHVEVIQLPDIYTWPRYRSPDNSITLDFDKLGCELYFRNKNVTGLASKFKLEWIQHYNKTTDEHEAFIPV